MTDRNGKVTVRHVRSDVTAAPEGRLIPAPQVANQSEARELEQLFSALTKKTGNIVGGQKMLSQLHATHNLDALRALRNLKSDGSVVSRDGRLALDVQAHGLSAEKSLTEEMLSAVNDVRWAFVHNSRSAGVDFQPGGTPPGWDEIQGLLFDDLDRQGTLVRLINEQKIVDVDTIKSMLARIEEYPRGLQEGVL